MKPPAIIRIGRFPRPAAPCRKNNATPPARSTSRRRRFLLW